MQKEEKKSRWRTWGSLYWSFFKVGILTFGGGLAMLPMLQREVVERRHWTDHDELLDIYAIGQCTPGVIAVNTATFLGNKVGRVIGAIVATLGMISPSLLIITAIAALFTNFADNPYVQHAMAAVRVCVVALIFTSVIKMCKGSFRWWPQIVIAVISFVLVAVFGANPIWVVIGAGLYGFFFMDLDKIRGRKKGDDDDA